MTVTAHSHRTHNIFVLFVLCFVCLGLFVNVIVVFIGAFCVFYVIIILFCFTYVVVSTKRFMNVTQG